MPGGRHHGGDLLDRQGVLVAAGPRGLPGEVLAEELELLAERAMQRDLAEGPTAGGNAALELVGVGGGDGHRETRAQQRRVAGRLQVPQQVASGLRALIALVAGPLVAVVLGAQDLVGVLDAPPHEPHGRPVGQEASVEGEVDREGQAVRDRGQESQLRGREDAALGQRADHELGLPADAEL